MMLSRRILLVSVALVVVVVAAIVLKSKGIITNNSAKNKVAKITNIIRRPNQAEDGYYGIEVQDNAGNTYRINATGYMNGPIGPDQFGEECVDVPNMQVGQKIEFNLPKSKYEQDTFDICFKKSSGNYYIR